MTTRTDRTPPRAPAIDPARLRAARCLAVAVAVVTAAISLAFLFAPAFSFDRIATYEPRNDHLVADIGAFQLGIAVALAGWAWRPDQRLGLWVALVCQSVHALSHLRDDLLGPSVDGSQGLVSALPNLGSWLLVVAVVALATPRTTRTTHARLDLPAT